MKRLLLATYKTADLPFYRRWAKELGCGLELHTLIEPETLADGRFIGELEAHQQQLHNFNGPLGLHGAFYDMVSASLDPDVVALTLRRYRQSLQAAVQVGANYVVFHANYMGGLKLANYRAGWHERQVLFWRSFAEEAAQYDIFILLENMWAGDPTIISDVLRDVDHPCLRACFDVSHAALFSEWRLFDWIDVLAPYLYCCHLNNHDGHVDRHWALGKGIIDYQPIIRYLGQLPNPPLMTLEMPDPEAIRASLPFFDLPEPA